MVSANPRESVLWTPRTQEMTGGFNPRQVMDHDVNPNEDGDGLSHHSRQSVEDAESHDQRDPSKRKERAMAELVARIPHVSIKPEKIDDVLGRNPMMEQEQTMLESGLGVDMGNRNGLGLSAGANVGSVRSTGPNVKFGGANSVVPFMLGKEDRKDCKKCGEELKGIVARARISGICSKCDPGEPNVRSDQPLQDFDAPFGDTSKIPYFTASEDTFTSAWDSIEKGRRKYRGRKYEEDEESDAEEKKAKKANKRKKKRGKRGVKSARGGRDPKSASKRRAGAVQLQIDRESRHQAFHPNVRSHAIRNVGSTRSEGIPLRLRDPVAWERKKAYERNRRAMGSLPTGLTHHADTRGVGKLGGTIGGTKGSSTRLPSVSRMGTSTSAAKFNRNATGDPLGTSDPLLAKSASKLGITRSELMNLKRKVESLMNRLNKLTKASPELDSSAKVGAPVNGDEASSPEGGTTSKVVGEPPYRFIDVALSQEMGLSGKR